MLCANDTLLYINHEAAISFGTRGWNMKFVNGRDRKTRRRLGLIGLRAAGFTSTMVVAVVYLHAQALVLQGGETDLLNQMSLDRALRGENAPTSPVSRPDLLNQMSLDRALRGENAPASPVSHLGSLPGRQSLAARHVHQPAPVVSYPANKGAPSFSELGPDDFIVHYHPSK